MVAWETEEIVNLTKRQLKTISVTVDNSIENGIW